MAALNYSDTELQAKAEQLGLVDAGTPLPRHLRSRVVAALAAEAARPATVEAVPVAREIVVQPGGDIRVDGKPFPWVIQADRVEVSLEPDGSGMVRLTIPTHNIQITKPVDESENRA